MYHVVMGVAQISILKELILGLLSLVKHMASQRDWPFPASVKSLRWRFCQTSLIGLTLTVSRLYLSELITSLYLGVCPHWICIILHREFYDIL